MAFILSSSRALTIFVALFSLQLGLRIAWAQEAPGGVGRRTATVTVATGPISVDGLLDEPVWEAAPPIGPLVQRQPDVGDEPTEHTRVTLLRDGANLYIGVLAFDSDPGRVIATQMGRDAGIGSDDRIEIVLDTFRDQRNAFYFATNPAGILLDGLVFANGELNSDWDTIWDVRVRRTAEGWSAEFQIPFKSLSFPAGQDAWGFNISRTIYRKLEEDRWSGARLETRFAQVSEAGEIQNMGRPSQGVGLELRPFVAGRQLHVNRTSADDFDVKPGLDLFYNFTPSLKLTGTFNTDFGETEADARQINLSRFSILFPEKRAFFLEDAGVFTFASTGPEPAQGIPGAGAEVFPFFSRQIGLLAGEEVPLDAGVKLTGRVGRQELGVLSVRAGDTPFSDERSFFVARLKRNFFQQSYVGGIVTHGSPAGVESARTVGADLRLATSRFLGASRNFVINAYGLRSMSPGVSDRNWSYGFSAHYPNDRYSAQIVMREIQQDFLPALGFVQRRNVRLLRVAGSFNPRPRFWNLQQMFHDVYYTRFTRLTNGELESEDLYVTLFDWHLQSGDNFHGMADFNVVHERLFEPFAISPGVILPVGDYRFTRFRHNFFSTASRRRVSGGLTLTWGNYWSGEAEQINANVTFRLPPRFAFTLSTNQTFARLPQGNFTARIWTSSIAYSASPFFSVSNLIQYDNRSRNLGWQGRARWTVSPGDDLFLSFQQGWIQDVADGGRFRAQESKLSAKLQYAFRF